VTKAVTTLLFLLFLLIPFQKRFHGYFDRLSRSLPLPDLPLPDFFSRKLHLFVSDFLIVALALLILFSLKTSLRAFFWEGSSKYLTLLFFAFFVSTATSLTKTYPLQYCRLFEFSLIFLFFNGIRCLSAKIDLPRFIYRLAWLIVYVSIAQCALGIYQYFTQEAIGLALFGEKSPKTFVFHNPGNHTWILNGLFGIKHDLNYLFRVSGTFLHPNILGGFLFFAILAAYYLYGTIFSKIKRIGLQLLILLQFFTLYLSFSRAAILALTISTLLWCVLQWNYLRRKRESNSASLKRLGILGGTVLCGVVAGIVLLYPQIKGRGGLINYNSVSKGADSERVIYMKVAVDMIKEHPLLGVGYNNFQLHSHLVKSKFPDNHLFAKVHNIYLLIASESGLIGGGFFLLFLVSLLRTAWRGFRSADFFQEKAFLFSTFLGFLIIGCCDFYFLEGPQGALPFFGVAGLLYGISSYFFKPLTVKYGPVGPSE